jgi:hypothetical protein
MFGFREDPTLQRLLSELYEAEKIRPRLPRRLRAPRREALGRDLPDRGHDDHGLRERRGGRRRSDEGRKVMPFRIEDEARNRGANYVQGGLWRSFAVRDGGSLRASSITRARRGPSSSSKPSGGEVTRKIGVLGRRQHRA